LTVNINIQNTGKTALYPWTLAWTFPGNQKITNTWNVNESQSGQNVTLSSISSWESIPAGGTLTGAVGFSGTYTGANAKPTAFTLNGQPCN
jgi:endoglucanase